METKTGELKQFWTMKELPEVSPSPNSNCTTAWYWHKTRSMKLKQRHKSTHLWTPDFWKRRLHYMLGERQNILQMLSVRFDGCIEKNPNRSIIATCGGPKKAYFYVDPRAGSWDLFLVPSRLLCFYFRQRSHLVVNQRVLLTQGYC